MGNQEWVTKTGKPKMSNQKWVPKMSNQKWITTLEEFGRSPISGLCSNATDFCCVIKSLRGILCVTQNIRVDLGLRTLFFD